MVFFSHDGKKNISLTLIVNLTLIDFVEFCDTGKLCFDLGNVQNKQLTTVIYFSYRPVAEFEATISIYKVVVC